MPKLGDYLGQLMSEIALARMHADLESIRIAELYASHPLLRTFPIPHLRLPEVNLDVAVLVQETEEHQPGGPPRGGIDHRSLADRFRAVLRRILREVGVPLTSSEYRGLSKAITARAASLALPNEVAVDVRRMADELTSATVDHLEQRPARGREARPVPDTFEARLREAARVELMASRTPAARLPVAVTSRELGEAGPEGITHLRLRITEQGLELTSVDGAGGSRQILVPE